MRTPESPIDDVVPAARPITVEDLLTFRAGWGFPSDFSLPAVVELFQKLPVFGPRETPDEWLATLARVPMLRQPGEAWLYNTCSDIQGVLVARVSGRPLPEFLAERIFEPLGMTDTGFHVPAEKLDRLPPYHGPDLAPIDDGLWTEPPIFPSGAGGLVSTLADWHRFGRMLLADGGGLLSPESVRLMTTDHLTQEQRRRVDAVPRGRRLGLRRRRRDADGRYGWIGGTGTTAHVAPSTGTDRHPAHAAADDGADADAADARVLAVRVPALLSRASRAQPPGRRGRRRRRRAGCASRRRRGRTGSTRSFGRLSGHVPTTRESVQPRLRSGYGWSVAEEYVLDVAGRSIAVTSPDKVFFSERGETKLDLVRYYLAVAEPLMRAAGGRPTLMQRFPHGAEGSSFFQKRVPETAPEWLQTTIVSTPNGTTSRALVLADMAHVVWAVNLACLGFHVWPYLHDRPDVADELRLDLDPQPGVGFDERARRGRRAPPPARRARDRRLPEDDRATAACTSTSGSSRAGTPTRCGRRRSPPRASSSGAAPS